MGPPAYTASLSPGSALFSNSRMPPLPPRLLRPGLGVPGRGEVGVSSAAGRYGGGRLTPPQEKRRPAPLQEKRRPSESSQLTERKRHWKAGEFPGSSAGRDGGRPAPPPEKRHWKAGEFLGTAAPPDSKASRTPLKNIKKRLDARADAKAWACTATEALADSINSKNWREALQVFEMLKEQPFYHPKEGTYMKLIVLLGRSGHAAQARQLFDEMLQQGCQPTPELYTALIGAYCRCGLLDESLQLLTDMKASPLCQPDVYTYSTIIKACVDASRFDLVEAMYKDMAERSISPNTVMQNIVLSGYGKAGRLDDMERMLSNMLDSTTCKPDVWTMNIILSLFGNRGQVEAMEEWYEKFRSYGIEPETRTLNILIGAYGKKRMYDKMSAVMEYMRKLAFPWTTATYNNVIEAFAEAGDAKNMEHTFNQMRSEGMKPDTKTFCCLINGFSKAGFFHKVVGMDKLAERLGVPTDTSFHNAILGACAKADDLMEMERVFMHMKHKQCDPDAMTYSILVEAYRKEGMTDKIYALHQENPTLVPTDLVMV
ncbi:pentatricopeptide repeat-containing protein At3g06430, chloroplastic-like [Panicum virgatum]|uniref:pentatricopeptide repeat-containing protein At3g06430, chloroplastic-like n=1 Tax=Panicum virgatum TaxID=38727 RepID=UPI0019D604EB|nr:pentatricopeptide repeat-containing protein At3g06430, chloroplastic-like [Panicum virgatum]KAG2481611.1 hypothetical protein PVAP13_J086950 [Panicum virgatum]KAG2481612.1 hypothetical protein PVAP13_J086950 [Panicum virgatum]KAG2481613.1 hypothetical protein PVAP13_J086950 [Panicum virgatum]